MSAGVEVGSPADAGAPLVPIAQLAARLGVTFRTLRFYEHRKLLTSVIIGNARHYVANECRKAAEIVRFRALGFGLADIGLLLPMQTTGSDQDALRAAIRKRIAELEERRREIEVALEELRQVQHERG
jgi:DNA-binding transcriptional MerR regulator